MGGKGRRALARAAKTASALLRRLGVRIDAGLATYIYELHNWPQFRWDDTALAERLDAVRFRQGRVAGRVDGLGFDLRREAGFDVVVSEVIRSSEIEGEKLNEAEVRSSVARQLGMDIGGLPPASRHVEGVVEMVLDATQQYADPLTPPRLCGWQASLFPTGYSGMCQVRTGAWRDDSTGPLQVVSGPLGKQRVHFQAPASSKVDGEMAAFLDWFDGTHPTNPIVKALLAHLWFLTIHPFDDGNGRIGRAILDMSLARAEGTALRYYSPSNQILNERNGYYRVLEATHRGTLDVTEYLAWFLEVIDKSLATAESTLDEVLVRSKFWQAHAATALNERQRKVLFRFLNGFEEKLTNAKWSKLAKCSHDTALRDLSDLVAKGILVKSVESGRGTSYMLALPE